MNSNRTSWTSVHTLTASNRHVNRYLVTVYRIAAWRTRPGDALRRLAHGPASKEKRSDPESP